MKVAFFDTHRFEKNHFVETNQEFKHDLTFFEARLTRQTVPLTRGFDAVCCFVNDQLNGETLLSLKENGIRLIALRSAGYNNVDVREAGHLGLKVVRVPAYSPHAVAEHAAGLILCLNRKLHKAYWRVHELNFSLEGLVGFDLHGKVAGIVGTGRIGSVMCEIMKGFGCEVLAYELNPNPELMERKVATYVPLDELYRRSDIISLHLPLTPDTFHLINAGTLKKMKSGVMLVNTGRGALIDSPALIEALKSGHVAAAALDVYEEEEGIFFEDLSDKVLKDDVLARLLTFPNVLITSHQAFLTREALGNIARTTLQNISDFERGVELTNQVPYSTATALSFETNKAES